MPRPTDPLVAEIVDQLDEDLRDEFEERAGIVEFDGNLSRAHAECLALLGLLRRHPEVVSGVRAVCVSAAGEIRWIVTTDLSYARSSIASQGIKQFAACDVAVVVRIAFGGLAFLSAVDPGVHV